MMTITIEKRDGKDWVVHSDINWARPATPDESALWAHKDGCIAELEQAIQRQSAAAIAGMNAAKAISSGQLREAHRLRAESSPEMLESERQANSMLTALIEQRTADYEHEKVMRLQCEARIVELEKRYERALAALALADKYIPTSKLDAFTTEARALMVSVTK